jgi:hypothetical protein
VIHRDGVLELGVEIFERYTGGPVDPSHLHAQAGKRVGLEFVVREVASWDHRLMVAGGRAGRDESQERTCAST